MFGVLDLQRLKLNAMVFLSSKKYACETCIKGHRSSTCRHTDRPLFEIKKKGRPVTQCEHCRELRKTKQVHVKCLCQTKPDCKDTVQKTTGSSNRKGGHKLLDDAVFPNGLPRPLEASVALQLISDGSDSSDHGEVSSCKCAFGNDCDCATQRKSVHRKRRTKSLSALQSAETDHTVSEAPLDPEITLPSQIVSRIAQLRPVRPRWSFDDNPGPLHDPSSGHAHTSASRHHTHDNMFFSPYTRAYEHVHHPREEAIEDLGTGSQVLGDNMPLSAENPTGLVIPSSVSSDSLIEEPNFEWNFLETTVFPPSCGCDRGPCLDSMKHDVSTVTAVCPLEGCADPTACPYPLDCTLVPVDPVPPDSNWFLYGDGVTSDWWGPIDVESTVALFAQSMGSPKATSLDISPPLPSHWPSENPQPQIQTTIRFRCEQDCPPGDCRCIADACKCQTRLGVEDGDRSAVTNQIMPELAPPEEAAWWGNSAMDIINIDLPFQGAGLHPFPRSRAAVPDWCQLMPSMALPSHMAGLSPMPNQQMPQ